MQLFLTHALLNYDIFIPYHSNLRFDYTDVKLKVFLSDYFHVQEHKLILTVTMLVILKSVTKQD